MTARLLVPGLAWLPALLVLLVPAWLLFRALEGGSDAWLRLGDAHTLELVGRSLGLAAVVVLGSIAIALPLAFLTVRTDLPGRRIWAVVLALPLALPSYLGAFMLISAFGPSGLLAETLGTPMPDLYGFGGAALALTLIGYPYVYLPIRAALAAADPSLEESARMLGASPIGAFRATTLPLIRPAIIAGALLIGLYALSDFGAVSMLQVDTFTRVIYTQHEAFDRSGAAALALVLIAITALILIAERLARRRAARPSARRGSRPGGPPIIPLGRWRWPAFLFCAVVAFLALGGPILVSIYWTAAGENVCEYCTPVPELAANSALVGLFTALTCMVLVVAVARTAVRGRGLAAELPDRVLYTGFALPGIVVALALVFIGTQWVPDLYQTLPLLVLACTVRFLPQASDTLRPAMARVPDSLEEAARTLGASATRAFMRVTTPLVSGSWLAGGALVFLTTVKELPATLLMRPTGFDTLATELWELTDEGFFADAGGRALALIVIGAIPMIALIIWTERRR